MPLQDEDQIRKQISDTFVDSGTKQRLLAHFLNLLEGSGWKEDMIERCNRMIDAEGVETCTVESLMAGLYPQANAAVPESVQKDIQQRISEFVQREIKALEGQPHF